MNNEDKILVLLESIAGDVGELKADVSGLKVGQKNLEAGQKKLQNDITIIKMDLKNVWQDILRLDKKIESQRDELETVKSNR